VRKKQLLDIDYRVASIREIPLEHLWDAGIRGVLFDLDNTLTQWRCMEISAETKEWFSRFLSFGFRACIVSNSDSKRVQPMGTMLGIPALHRAGKPCKRVLLKACRKLELLPHQVAMAGDQLFTDIIAGNRAGLTTILTEEMAGAKEFWGTKLISRRLERVIARREAAANRE